MSSLHPSLHEVRTELERSGFRVVPHGDHLCVRLPLFASVRVRLIDGNFHFAPQFGPVSRTTGLLVTSGLSTAAVAAVAIVAASAPLTVLAAFVGVVAVAHDACRFVLTEGCLTRLQQIVAARLVASRASPGHAVERGQNVPMLPAHDTPR